MRAAGPGRPREPLAELLGLVDVVPVSTGASGQVFRARQPEVGREVAVTVFDVTVADPRTRLRVERELAVVGRVPAHPCLLGVLEHGATADGHPYLLTPWCPGGSLDALVARGGGPVPVTTALEVGVRIGVALGHLHAHGVVHGEVEPSRVLLDANGRALLGGLPLTGASGSHVAPEVLGGGPVTAASDVWALASTVVFALAGRPLLGSSVAGTPPPLVRPDVPVALSRLLRRTLAAHPGARPSAVELAAGLRDVQSALGLAPTEVVVRAPAPWTPAAAAPLPRPGPRLRGRLATTGLSLGGAALGVALGLGVLDSGQAVLSMVSR